ncbi:gustatory and odorant receptor 22-like [Aethina tumida]|uniref:gustatory and odorant receptor 22-like n=1 Tax=Aethina tumida TaxID=116153 RepID=UPI00096B3457|nr:gustatory and odorant receptor 22-like [Aethina tumida]
MQLSDLPDLYGNELNMQHFTKLIRGSPRTRAIKDRLKWDKKNYDLIEEHDQFYRDHKLLLSLFRVLAVMPVQRDIGRIKFSWKSPPMIYAYFFYAITTILVFLVGWERLDILTNRSKKFDEYIYSIIFVVYLIPHFWIPFVGWGVAYEVCDYKNSWGSFQLLYFQVTGKNLEFPYLSTLIVIISMGSVIVAIIFLLTLSVLMEGFTLYHTIAYYHIITMINMNCALWYINCRAIGNASTALADSFEKDLEVSSSAFIIAQYRYLWLLLSELLQKLGNAYARTYSTYSLFMMMNITIAVYGFTSEIIDHGLKFSFKEIGLLVDGLYCLTLFFVFCNCSHQASANIANRVQFSLMNINVYSVDVETTKEIQLFLKAIQNNPPKVSLKGYTVVNRELITSSLATVAIYLIVLLQFKISLINLRG